MEGVKRWGPFVGSFVIVLCEVLKACGYVEAANAIMGVVALILPTMDTKEQATTAMAVLSMAGLLSQLYSRYQKASGKDEPYTVRVR